MHLEARQVQGPTSVCPAHSQTSGPRHQNFKVVSRNVHESPQSVSRYFTSGWREKVFLPQVGRVVLEQFQELIHCHSSGPNQRPEGADGELFMLWNGEIDGPWFRFGENDVLVDEWER